MQKSKRNTLIVIAAVILLLVLFLLIEGVQIGIAGVLSFSTKYYRTPEEAFSHFDLQPFELSQSVDYVPIDEYNGMFVGITNEGYIFVSMQNRSGKYYCSGEYMVVNSDIYWSFFHSGGGARSDLYSKWGRYQGHYTYYLVYDEADLQQLGEDLQVHRVTSETNGDFYFAYRVERD